MRFLVLQIESFRQLGPIDILVNNAGVSQRSLAKDTPMDVDRRIMEINFFGAVAVTKAILPSMIQQKKWTYYHY